MKRRIRHVLSQVRLSLKFSVMIFIILCLAGFISALIMHVVVKLGILPNDMIADSRVVPIILLVTCIIIGTILSIVASRSAIKAAEQFIEASSRLANGDFTARIEGKGLSEFRRMAENFNHMAKELGSIEVLRSDFINNFSHEFRTPIVSIKGFAEILKYDDLTVEEREEYLNIVIEESSRLASLANNVLEASKLDQQSILTNKQIFNLGEQIRQCVLLLDAKISEKDINLDLNIHDYKVEGNKDMMSQVWINLLDNAIKFTPQKGSIHLYMKREDDKIKIEIQDTGCGIKQEAVAKIFDKFYQADMSHATKGNGLGLSIVKKIVELHGGSIACESEWLKGTTFMLLLPAVKE